MGLAIPHCNVYQQFLANAELKNKFLRYLMDQFIQLSCCKRLPVQIIIDYDDLSCPISIYNGGQTDLAMLKINNGEADYNVWYHCMMSTSRHIIILGSDTDIWVYGLAFLDCGWINNKVVYIEKSIGSEYAHLNAFSEAVSTHPKLNVTRYEKRDRSGYFIIFAFLVSIDSYACVRSNGAN